VKVVGSLDQALELAAEIARSDGVDELVVIGGEQIYREALPRAQRLYLTEVHADIDGDTVLPPVRWEEWREISRERHTAQGANPYDYSFVVFERR
jgi:dihydrofolate reductase